MDFVDLNLDIDGERYENPPCLEWEIASSRKFKLIFAKQ
jgi:hypothetical protein